MKPKTMVLLVVAVTCGLAASYMTSRLLAQRSDETDATVDVLVASKALDQGMMIKNVDESFGVKTFLQGQEPKGAINKKEELQGKVLKRSMREGDFVTGGDLLSKEDQGIAAMISKGFQVIGVRVNLESIAGGFASLPHSTVDIILTIRRGSGSGGDSDSFAKRILQKVLVVGIDQNISRDEQGRAMPGNVVLLALKPEDVLKVNIAKELGSLSLALRKFDEKLIAENDKVTAAQLLTGTTGKEQVEETKVAKAELPKLPAPKTVAEVQDDPTSVWTLRIQEGENQKLTQYVLDKDGKVVQRDVVRSDVAPPRPPQPVVVAQPTPPPAPVDGPAKDDQN